MGFSYHRTIHFPDTDAAGVVFFANYLSICHEAYEEALGAAGLGLKDFFAANEIIVPISKSSAEYLRPLFCGDKIVVTLKPTLLSPDTYAIDYEMRRADSAGKIVAHARTAHVCIRSTTRERTPLPPALLAWINAPAA